MKINNINVDKASGRPESPIYCCVCGCTMLFRGGDIVRLWHMRQLSSDEFCGNCRQLDDFGINFALCCFAKECIDLFKLNPLAYE
jgi:hypothetical protein